MIQRYIMLCSQISDLEVQKTALEKNQAVALWKEWQQQIGNTENVETIPEVNRHLALLTPFLADRGYGLDRVVTEFNTANKRPAANGNQIHFDGKVLSFKSGCACCCRPEKILTAMFS